MTNSTVFRLVDAFADRPFSGNSAGVLLAADGLTDAQMQLIAREINASETAFICGGNDLHRPARLRWFTPTVEAGFCGHATLAAAHAWAEVIGIETFIGRDAGLEFETAAGRLLLRAESSPDRDGSVVWWLAMPDPSFHADNTNPMRTCELLGMRADNLVSDTPVVRTRDGDVILLLESWHTLVELQPDFQALAKWSSQHQIRGLCCATRHTLSGSIHVASRFFAPAVGINEDPVTGSVHGPLGAFLVSQGLVGLVDGRALLQCVQGIPGGRCGLVRILIESGNGINCVFIGGRCHTTIRGELRIPTID